MPSLFIPFTFQRIKLIDFSFIPHQCCHDTQITCCTDVNLTDGNTTSPLYSAVEMGHYDIVEFLLQNGADVNIRNYLGPFEPPGI
jgi:ankyrin repeat protein